MSEAGTIPSICAPSSTTTTLPSDTTASATSKNHLASKSSVRKELQPAPRRKCWKLKKTTQPSKPLKSSLKKHYFTKSDRPIVKATKIKTSPFIYPKDLEIFAEAVKTKVWRKSERVKELEKQCSEKCSYRDKQRTDLRDRLNVEDAGFNTMKTIMDADPDYYKIVAGRPVSDPFNRSQYIESLRETLRTKIIVGYKRDEIMSINENIYLEKRLIEEITEHLQTYVDTFEEFLNKDHEESMKILHEAETEEQLRQIKYNEFKELAKEYASLRSIVYKLEEKWRHSKSYQKFLYLVSPMSWRKEHDTINETTFHTKADIKKVFNKYDISDEATDSLDNLLKRFKDDCSLKNEPLLYFSEPKQLLHVFKFLEMQNLNALLHIEELAEPITVITEGMRIAEKAFDDEIHALRETINKLEGSILWEEERASYLEELSNTLINKDFKALTTNVDALNLQVFVEDVYETRIGPNNANLNIVEMMKTIEIQYRSELLKLDKLPKDQVSMLEGNYYAEQMQIMRLAEKAAKEYIELERILNSLSRALEPPYVKKGKELKQRSPPINPPKPPVIPPRDLTQEETDYLDFFTNYCQRTDNLLDFGINIALPPQTKDGLVENDAYTKK